MDWQKERRGVNERKHLQSTLDLVWKSDFISKTAFDLSIRPRERGHETIARWILPRSGFEHLILKAGKAPGYPMIARQLEEVQCYESVPMCEACRGNTVRLDSTRAACLWPSLILKKLPTPTIPRKVLNIRRSLCLGLTLVQLCFSHRLPAISMRQNTKLFLGMVNSRPSRLRPLW